MDYVILNKRTRNGVRFNAGLGVVNVEERTMWKLLHLMFGWDYIQWRNSADQGVARVRIDGLGRCYYWRYVGIGLADIIRDAEQVVWLTCRPQKYMGVALVIDA